MDSSREQIIIFRLDFWRVTVYKFNLLSYFVRKTQHIATLNCGILQVLSILLINDRFNAPKTIKTYLFD